MKIVEKFNEYSTMKFFLEDEHTEKCYWFFMNFKDNDDFDNFIEDDPDFEIFMEKMECSSAPWSGVHDCTGSEIAWGYSSYEIKDFETAIKMWNEFFKNKNKLINDEVYVSESFDDLENSDKEIIL